MCNLTESSKRSIDNLIVDVSETVGKQHPDYSVDEHWGEVEKRCIFSLEHPGYSVKVEQLKPYPTSRQDYDEETNKRIDAEIEECKKRIQKRRESSSKSIADSFPGSLHYHLTKVVEATISESVDGKKAGVDVKVILKSIKEVKENLLEQEGVERFEQEWKFDFEYLTYSLIKLKTYFLNPDETDINEKDAFIFAYFVNQFVRELKDRVESLDENN